ncbi:hypothetical protein N866_01090 [Actinotalea ferrariae CF5-4]|uniref:Uncharacterized protein n=1 Tax=Actinotalea ferrariae CF5-4 TaxID=948458 RepID=A0A021VTM4_9CELL|nr:hypothetical protein [Actinotalea ferrariae]EYR63380.1 hypothetical protein N866_01090 [Actinotalea ferrariae CF5-4]
MHDSAPRTIGFRVDRDDGRTEVEPVVGGTPLRDLVAAFEREEGHEPAGGYAGLVLEHFDFGDLAAYLVGRDPRQWPRPGRLWLLACDCGEVGCWPLEASVTADADDVTWSDFRQPHRPERRYDGFGPFTFSRGEYAAAVAEALRVLGDGGSSSGLSRG